MNSSTVTVRLKDNLIAEADRLAASMGISRSKLFAHLIEARLEVEKQWQDRERLRLVADKSFAWKWSDK